MSVKYTIEHMNQFTFMQDMSTECAKVQDIIIRTYEPLAVKTSVSRVSFSFSR
jgi:hypothetical protein